MAEELVGETQVVVQSQHRDSLESDHDDLMKHRQ